MVKIQKPIPKKLENKPKLDNPIKKKKQQQKKEKSSTKNTKLLDDSTPIKEAKVSLKPGKGDIAKKQPNKKELNGEKKIEKKPLILAPEPSPEQKKNPKGKKQNKNKDKNGVDAVAESSENSVKNGVEEAAKPTVVPQKNNKKQSKLAEKVAKSTEVPEKANKEKPAKPDNKIKPAAKTGPAVEQKKLENPVTAPAKEGKKKNNKKSAPEAKPTPAIEKIKKVEKPKVALQKNKKVKNALKKVQNTPPGKPKHEKEQSAFRYDPIPYDEERFNSIVNLENIKKIAEALKTTVEAEVKTKKSSIFDDYGYFLQVCSFKIPTCPKRVVKLNLTHSLVDKEDDILLVVPDLQRGIRADYENTKHHYEDLLKQNGVEGITVMPMNQLRKEHGSFEQRRKLCATYDYFLCDGRILGHVGKLIGKLTQKPRNTIHSVRFNEKKHLKSEIEKALKRTAYRQLSKGSLQTIPVGTHKHSSEQVAENIVSVVEQLKKSFPGGMGNVRNLHLRINLIGTSSLPLYISMAQAPEKTPVVIGPKEQRLLKLKKEANDVLAKFSMTKDGKLVKLTKPAAERKRKLQEMAAALKEGGEEESSKKAKKDPNDQGEKKSKKNVVKEVKELELPENEEEDDDTSDESDEDAVQLGQGSDDEETEDDDMANLDEEDTESGAEIVENGLVDDDDEESEENDGQEVNQGENDDDDEDDEEDEDDDDDEDEDDEEESD